MKAHNYLLPQTVLLTVFLLVIFYILEYGFIFDTWIKLIQPSSLAVLTMLNFFKPQFKLYTFYLISVCLVVMILAYLLNLLNFSKIMADFGFSLLVITIFLYLPQIIKKGHIERF